MTMPAGTYYIGDLCYVLEDSWQEVCDITGEAQGEFKLSDGRRFTIFGTAYGDGEYLDQHRRTYSVDSGTIGCVKVTKNQAKEVIEEGLAQIVKFDAPFECYSDGGTLVFGNIYIDTTQDCEDQGFSEY